MPDQPQQTDLTAAAASLAAVVGGVRDDQLAWPTPCDGLSVGDLLHHVETLAPAFTRAATKEGVPEGVDPSPTADAAQLDPRWRTLVPQLLRTMAAAWGDPAAWTGQTEVGGIGSTGAECGAVAADELVVHAWDLARATGQDHTPDDAATGLALAFVEPTAAAMPQGVPGLFGPAVAVPDGASSFERLLALTGRDGGWQRQPSAR